jgi:hypothetical protein
MPQGWECTHAVATVVDGTRHERLCDHAAEPLSLVLRSAPVRGRFRIVDVGAGTAEADYAGLDVRGAVVLAGGPVTQVHEQAVEERGAAGLLTDTRRLVHPVRDAFDEPDALAYTSFWWGEDGPRGWGFVVTPRTAARLRARLRAGAVLELEAEIRSRAFDTDIPLVSAALPGRGAREVLVLAHLCHPQPSANDNASGVAAALETARALAALRARGAFPDTGRTVRFLWVPEITGTHAWLAADPARAARTVAALNLDMVGEDQQRCGSVFLLEHPPAHRASFAEELLARIRADAVDWVESYSGPGHVSHTRMAEVPYGGGSDHAVLLDPALGVPCPLLIQWPDRFYHSSHDTPDKTDPASLALAARCAATYAAWLAGAGEAEARALLGAVGRGARRRLLAAADVPDAPLRVARERLRAQAALASLERLGLARDEVTGAMRALGEFAQREIAVPAVEPPADAVARAARPVRATGAPLDMMRHLMPGWRALRREEREAWRAADEAVPGGALTFELAWQAADGERSVDRIARMVWLETGVHAPAEIAAFFERAAGLGLCRLEA